MPCKIAVMSSSSTKYPRNLLTMQWRKGRNLEAKNFHTSITKFFWLLHCFCVLILFWTDGLDNRFDQCDSAIVLSPSSQMLFEKVEIIFQSAHSFLPARAPFMVHNSDQDCFSPLKYAAILLISRALKPPALPPITVLDTAVANISPLFDSRSVSTDPPLKAMNPTNKM